MLSDGGTEDSLSIGLRGGDKSQSEIIQVCIICSPTPLHPSVVKVTSVNYNNIKNIYDNYWINHNS
jgi:hypothetical protein